MFDNRLAMELQNLYGPEFRKLTIPQMLERTKLIQILESAESAVYWNSSDKGFIEKIADHLVANGVTIPVRCKECQFWIHIGGGKGDCTNGRFHLDDCPDPTMMAEEFCCLGERKDNG